MSTRALMSLAPALLAGCVAAPPLGDDPGVRPLEVLPGDATLAVIEADLLATARERYGPAALQRALAAPTHIIVKRFAGMAPPPPPGAAPGWMPATPSALLMREDGRWLIATPDGWRDADRDAAAEIDAALASREFWNEPAASFPCPDYGASLMLLKAPQRARTVRNSKCPSISDRIVQAALRA
jgi:hypothetical protein